MPPSNWFASQCGCPKAFQGIRNYAVLGTPKLDAISDEVNQHHVGVIRSPRVPSQAARLPYCILYFDIVVDGRAPYKRHVLIFRGELIGESQLARSLDLLDLA